MLHYYFLALKRASERRTRHLGGFQKLPCVVSKMVPTFLNENVSTSEVQQQTHFVNATDKVMQLIIPAMVKVTKYALHVK